ncbi:MAG TPA: hypothetical protein VHO24_16985 [Opitutaceae bacterium]|nr:hypothetical protein [Opitutaceae bacterium]
MTLAALDAVSLSSAPGWLSFSAAIAWSLAKLRGGDTSPPAAKDWKWWALIALALLAFRWPLLWVPHQNNPDESQLIAGAITLRHDPVFWRSVDGGTAGPAVFYPLLPSAWAHGTAAYATARLIALATVFFTLVFAAKTVALFSGAALARIAVLPAVGFHAFTTNPDFTHYSTELTPALLIAIAGYLAVLQARTPRRRLVWIIALLLGSVPWAKPQAVPLAAVLWLCVVVSEFRASRRSSFAPLLIGGLIPTLACFGLAAISGQTEHLIVPFFLHNFAYVQKPAFSWGQAIGMQWQNALLDGYLACWIAATAVTLLLALGFGSRTQPPLKRTTWLAALLLVVGVYCALGPRRPSAHHLQLLTLPFIWATGAALAVASVRATGLATDRTRWIASGAFLLAALAPQIGWRMFGPDPFAPFNHSGLSQERRELTKLVREFSAPDEPVGIWGWRCSLYVEAGRSQATRQAQTEAQIHPSPLQSYFLQRYFEDIQATNPPVFVDSVGPGNFAFVSANEAHEVFPPLREWVRTHYTHVASLDGTRFYLRNDRLPPSAAKSP